MTRPRVERERLRELLDYDSETGVFTWRKIVGKSNRKVGDQAGTLNHGYISIRLDGVRYQAHVLAWVYSTGSWPKHDIDHVNGVRSDNRMVNLRDVPRKVNNQNKRPSSVRSDSTTGSIGVKYDPRYDTWSARITSDYTHHHLGTFATPEEASAAYWKAKAELHKEALCV